MFIFLWRLADSNKRGLFLHILFLLVSSLSLTVVFVFLSPIIFFQNLKQLANCNLLLSMSMSRSPIFYSRKLDLMVLQRSL